MQSIPDDLKNMLGPSEQVQLYIRQKIYHPKINVDSVVIIVRYQSPFTAMAAGMPPMRQPSAPASFSSASCRRCGSALVAGQKFCGNCGLPV